MHGRDHSYGVRRAAGGAGDDRSVTDLMGGERGPRAAGGAGDGRLLLIRWTESNISCLVQVK